MNVRWINLRAAVLAASCCWATATNATDPTIVGTYDLTFATGQVSMYTVHRVTENSALVTYSYGGKERTAELPVRKKRIIGSGWFPTAWFNQTGITRATFPGNRAAAKRARDD